MLGHRKGNQVRRATEMVDKLSPPEHAAPLSQLKAHLRLVNKAMRLTTKSTLALTDS